MRHQLEMLFCKETSATETQFCWICAGTEFQSTQQPLQSTQSFEELDLTKGNIEAGQPERPRATSILLSWQPESGMLLCKPAVSPKLVWV